MEYDKGLRYASEIITRIEKWCSRIEIGGGIRRKKAEPHDIEIIAKPKEGLSLKQALVEIIEKAGTKAVISLIMDFLTRMEGKPLWVRNIARSDIGMSQWMSL